MGRGRGSVETHFQSFPGATHCLESRELFRDKRAIYRLYLQVCGHACEFSCRHLSVGVTCTNLALNKVVDG